MIENALQIGTIGLVGIIGYFLRDAHARFQLHEEKDEDRFKEQDQRFERLVKLEVYMETMKEQLDRIEGKQDRMLVGKE